VKPFSVHPGDPIFDPTANLSFVMPGLVPGIHVFPIARAPTPIRQSQANVLA
jgi:hypothetical protein